MNNCASLFFLLVKSKQNPKYLDLIISSSYVNLSTILYSLIFLFNDKTPG